MSTRVSLLALLMTAGCDGSSTETDLPLSTDTDLPSTDGFAVDDATYAFPSRADGQVDSVAFSGQIFRQVLIDRLKAHTDGLTGRLDTTFTPSAGDVRDELEFFYDFDSASAGTLPIGLTDAVQVAWDDLGSDKNLTDKIAGNDPVGQHRDWDTDLRGLDITGSPEVVVRTWMDELDAASVLWSQGVYPLTPDGTPVGSVTVTADGRDLGQLLQKFLRVSVGFSQGADDYLDDDEPGKGLLSDHTAVEEGQSYTSLEHQWDEGFGYFGASVYAGGWSDAELAEGFVDVDGDGERDLLEEVAYGHSKNAAKRDLGSSSGTDFSGDAFEAFHAGRKLLAETDGALTPDELDTLRGHRDDALLAWEKVMAATAVHYINQTLADMAAADVDYSFDDHAKHWSELKGFALAFQFNPHSTMTDAQFDALHVAIGNAPVLRDQTTQVQDAYAAGLRQARATLGTVYGFDSSDLGDDDGANGW